MLFRSRRQRSCAFAELLIRVSLIPVASSEANELTDHLVVDGLVDQEPRDVDLGRLSEAVDPATKSLVGLARVSPEGLACQWLATRRPRSTTATAVVSCAPKTIDGDGGDKHSP